MPTREEITRGIEASLESSGMTPSDPLYKFARETMEQFNDGLADLDDELDAIAQKLSWLARSTQWTNERKPKEFAAFVDEKLAKCKKALTDIEERWKKQRPDRATGEGGNRAEP